MAVMKAKKRAKKPPAAARDMRREITMALTVAATKKSIKTVSPVKARRAIVPTCSNFQNSEKVMFPKITEVPLRT